MEYQEETPRQVAARKALEAAIAEFIDASKPGSYVTDWAVICAAISSDGDNAGQTAYVMAQNPMPYHHTLGLVKWAQLAVESSDE